MKTILTLVLSLGVLFLKAQDSLSTFYFPPVIAASINRSEWELPYEQPLVLHMTTDRYFLKAAGVMSHKETFLTISISFAYRSGELYDDIQDAIEKGVTNDEIFHPDYFTLMKGDRSNFNFISTKNPDYAVWVKTNCPPKDSLKKEVLRQFMSTLHIVDPAEIDKASGYPVDPGKMNIDSLRNERRKIYNEVMQVEYGTDSYTALRGENNQKFDKIFMRDVKYHFSYAEYHREMLKDVTRSFSTDEYLSYWFSPDSLKTGRNLKGYDSDEHFELPGYAAKEFSKLRKYKTEYRWNDQVILDKNMNKGFILLENDSMWNLLYAEKGKTTWAIKDHPGNKGRIPKQRKIRPFDLYYSNNDKEFMLIYLGNHAETAGALFEEPTNVSVVDVKNGMTEAIDFAQPEKWETYPMIIEFQSLEEKEIKKQWLEYSYVAPVRDNVTFKNSHMIRHILYGKAQAENKSGTSIYSLDYYDQWKPEQRLFISPVFFTDLDTDGKKEIWRASVSNGKVISTELYEKGEKGYTKITIDQAWAQRLSKHEALASIMKKSEETTFFNPGNIEEGVEGEDAFEFPVDENPRVRNEIRDDQVLSFAQEMPSYPGGDAALQEELHLLIGYPEVELRNKIEGTVYIELIVEKDGSISNAKISRGVTNGPGLGTAVLEAMNKLSKKFSPAKQNGKVVRVTITIPVKFKI